MIFKTQPHLPQSEIETVLSLVRRGIIAALCIMLFLLCGCTHTKEVIEIKHRVIQPAAIEDSIRAVVINDSVIIGAPIYPSKGGNASDSSLPFEIGNSGSLPFGKGRGWAIVKYFPKLEKFYIKVKPDSIIIWDTLKTFQTIEKVVETPFLSKMGLVFIGIGICVVFVVLKQFVRK